MNQVVSCQLVSYYLLLIIGLCSGYHLTEYENSLNILILGSSVGLSLILNVEQYEYMRGPQNDAGVKVKYKIIVIILLHENFVTQLPNV